MTPKHRAWKLQKDIATGGPLGARTAIDLFEQAFIEVIEECAQVADRRKQIVCDLNLEGGMPYPIRATNAAVAYELGQTSEQIRALKSRVPPEGEQPDRSDKPS
jgi:hypothetical protein